MAITAEDARRELARRELERRQQGPIPTQPEPAQQETLSAEPPTETPVQDVVPTAEPGMTEQVSDHLAKGFKTVLEPQLAFALGTRQGATKFQQGMTQLQAAVGESVGKGLRYLGAENFGKTVQDYWSGFYDEVTEDAEKQRSFYKSLPLTKTIPAQSGEFVGEMLPWVVTAPVVPEAAAARIAAATTSGVVGGAAQLATEEGDRQKNMIFGGLFGLGGGTLFESTRPVINLVRQNVRAALHSPYINRAYNRMRGLSEATGTELSVSQMIPSPTLAGIEASAAGSSGGATIAGELVDRQLDRSRQRIQSVITKLHPSTKNPEIIGKQIKNAIAVTVETVDQANKLQFQKGLDKAVELSNGAPIIPTKNLAEATNKIINDLQTGVTPAKASTLNVFKNILKKIDDAKVSRKGRLTIEEVQADLSKWRARGKDTGRLFEDLSTEESQRAYKSLVRAINQDMDDLQRMGSLDHQEAVNTLRKTRDAYRTNKAKIDDLKDNSISSLLNKTGVSADPEKFVDTLGKMNPSALKKIMPTLDEFDPAIMNNVRANILEQALDKAKVSRAPGTLGTLGYSNKEFLKALPDDARIRTIFEGSTKKDLLLSMKMMNEIASEVSHVTGISSQNMAVDIGRNVGTAAATGTPNATFATGLAIKLLAPSRVAKAMMTKEGREAVMNLSKSNRVFAEQAAARSLGVVIGAMSDSPIE